MLHYPLYIWLRQNKSETIKNYKITLHLGKNKFWLNNDLLCQKEQHKLELIC